VMLATICDAQLSSTFYDSTCPNALSTIRNAIRSAVSKERRMAASLIRLHFHDCFVQVITSFIIIFVSICILLLIRSRYKYSKRLIGQI
jgi:peroxidase